MTKWHVTRNWRQWESKPGTDPGTSFPGRSSECPGRAAAGTGRLLLTERWRGDWQTDAQERAGVTANRTSQIRSHFLSFGKGTLPSFWQELACLTTPLRGITTYLRKNMNVAPKEDKKDIRWLKKKTKRLLQKVFSKPSFRNLPIKTPHDWKTNSSHVASLLHYQTVV